MVSRMMTTLLIFFAICAVAVLFIYLCCDKFPAVHTSGTVRIKKFKIKLGKKPMVIFQNDQEFDLTLTYTDDGGEAVDVESIEATSSTEAISVTEPEQVSTGVYKMTVRGVSGTTGSGDINVTADARFGEEVRLIEYALAVSTTPNEAEGVNAEIGELRNQ